MFLLNLQLDLSFVCGILQQCALARHHVRIGISFSVSVCATDRPVCWIRAIPVEFSSGIRVTLFDSYISTRMIKLTWYSFAFICFLVVNNQAFLNAPIPGTRFRFIIAFTPRIVIPIHVIRLSSCGSFAPLLQERAQEICRSSAGQCAVFRTFCGTIHYFR